MTMEPGNRQPGFLLVISCMSMMYKEPEPLVI